MSWVEKVKENIVITTGDGKTYSPLYVISDRKIEFNISKFDFVNVDGTLVKRTTAMGGTFPLEITFQGEDNLDVAAEFEKSSLDNRPWTIFHPVYGSKLVHPGSLTFDSSGYNITVITGEYHETISDEYPNVSKNPIDEVNSNSEQTSILITEDFNNTVAVDTSVLNQMNDSTGETYSIGASSIKSGDQANEYFSLYTESSAAILTGISDVSNMTQKAINLIEYPYRFADTVKARIQLFTRQINILSTDLGSLINPKNKKTYEFNVLALMNGIIKTTINPQAGDYTSSVSVFEVISQVISTYNSVVENLDFLQTDNNGTTSSYVPSFSSLNSLSQLVNYTVSNLYSIALDAKQERKLILENESNPILLAHRFYGSTDIETKIDYFISTNNIGVNEYFGIKKGRVVTYFV